MLKHITELSRVIGRGLHSKCPRCGRGKLFERWNTLFEFCSECRLPLQIRDNDTWFFMYMSTAAITGTFVLFMLFLTPPRYLESFRVLLGVCAFAVFIFSTNPRKGIAIAIDYFIDAHSEFPKNM